jgi:predicted phage tail protein
VKNNITETSFKLTNKLANGTYYWRVKAVDGAGNESPFVSGSFTVYHKSMPIWVWVIIGVVGAIIIGVAAIILRSRLTKK